MLETKEQKQYFVTAVVLIVILSLVSLLSRPDFMYVDQSDYKQLQAQEEANRLAYVKYLENLKVDPVASKELFQELFTEQDIQNEVVAQFQATKPVVKPDIKTSELKVVENSGQAAFVDYISKTTGLGLVFGTKTAGANEALFSKDLNEVKRVNTEFKTILKELYETPVPSEALALHKALVSSFVAYGNVVNDAEKYAVEESQDPWPNVYQALVVVNDSMRDYSTELARLAGGYKIADAQITPYYAVEKQNKQGFVFIKTAHAFLGVGDVTITVGDIPRLIMDAVKEGLIAATAQFMSQFLTKFIAKIEQNYLVANFLFYSDALISGQYTQDYLAKYVSNQLDRQIVKRFIPQFSCGAQPTDLKPVFQAKAQTYLGFDPRTLDPNDPKYFQKLAKVGDFMSSPNGWQLYYEDLASVAKSEAEKAADRELSSSGLKTPRDTLSKGITNSINSIVSSQRAAFQNAFNLGIANAGSFIKTIVSGLTQSLVNQFVFKGATQNGGTVGVLKEQSVCLASAQITPVLPVGSSNFQDPPPPPDEEDLIQQECAKLSGGCGTPQEQTLGSPPEIP